jgi:hypothetical protein
MRNISCLLLPIAIFLHLSGIAGCNKDKLHAEKLPDANLLRSGTKQLTYELANLANYDIRYDGDIGEKLAQKGSLVIGNVNGDAYDDLIIGAPEVDRVYIVFGSSTPATGNKRFDNPSDYNLSIIASTDDMQNQASANFVNISVGDVNGDSLDDLIIGAPSADNNGSNSGSVWVIFSSLLSPLGNSTGNEWFLSNNTSYNIRFDGSVIDQYISTDDAVAVGDVNGDTLGDLIIGSDQADYNSATNSGSVWVIFSTLIDDTGTSTGITRPFSAAGNYNIRYDGAATNDLLSYGGIHIGNVNGDSYLDLLIGASGVDGAGTDRGSLYILFSTLLDDFGITTDNNRLLSTTTNFNVRFDGDEDLAGRFPHRDFLKTGDVNGDYKTDLVFGAEYHDGAGTDRGSVWVVYSDILTGYGESTQNILDLSPISTDYNIRFEGAFDFEYLSGGGVALGDLNGDSLGDLVIGSFDAAGGGSMRGSVWVVFSTLLDDVQPSSTGNVWSLLDGSSYNIQFDGESDGDSLGFLAPPQIGDVNWDGHGDLIVGSSGAAYAGANSGSIWQVYSTFIDDVGETTGNSLPFSNTNNYKIRYDGTAASDFLARDGSLAVGDLNDDSVADLAIGADGADGVTGVDSGSVWVILSTLGTVLCTVDDDCGPCYRCNASYECEPQSAGQDLKGDCDDLVGCTDDYCDGAGACQFVANDVNCADDLNDCTTDRCDQALDCQYDPVANDTPCPDATVCNGDETCQSGTCTAGTPLDCDDTNECTSDSCDPVLGCQHPPVANDTPCPDATVCNGDETCQAGTCTAGTPLNCDDSNECTSDSCDAISGCQNPQVADDTPCPDATVCNGDETCQTGTCTAGTPLNCDDSNECTSDSCDAISGCQNPPVANDTPCPDTTVCNGDETCQAGVCTAGTPLDCDDINECTSDSCDAVSGCQNDPLANDTPCPDATVCNGDETCQAGICTAGTPLNCDDSNECTADSCDAVSGCQNPQVADNTPCLDATVCNGEETCQAGVCTAGSPLVCDDGEFCTTDSCDAVSGCQNDPVANDTPCPDATVCNGDETCQGGVCTAGTPLNCDDSEFCTNDSCDDVSGCQNNPLADDTPCPDGDFCNGDETCQLGVCSLGIPPNCDDTNVCTNDSCDPASGCQNIPVADNTPCPDATVCNGDETCQSGTCTAGTPLNCDDTNFCTSDSCDPVSGCQNNPVANDTPCPDSTVCNGDETCQTGVCTPGTPLNCDFGNACMTYSCDNISGCQEDFNNGAICSVGPCIGECRNGLCDRCSCVDASGCDDSVPCTIDSCQNEACINQPDNTLCDDENICTHDVCDSENDCQNNAVDDGTPCPDQDYCNGTETCQLGVCSDGVAPTCDDSNSCTDDRCDSIAGCKYDILADNTPCPDATICNGDETCQAGTCTAGTPLPTGNPCDDGFYCSGEDACDGNGECIPSSVSPCGCVACDESSDSCVQDELLEDGEECTPPEMANLDDCIDRGLCISGDCLIDAKCDDIEPTCGERLIYGESNKECRLPADKVGILVNVEPAAADLDGLISVRVKLTNLVFEFKELYDLRLVIDLGIDEQKSIAFVVESASIEKGTIPVTEEPDKDNNLVALVLGDDQTGGLPVDELGWTVEFALVKASSASYNIPFGLQVWAPCSTGEGEIGCHFELNPGGQILAGDNNGYQPVSIRVMASSLGGSFQNGDGFKVLQSPEYGCQCGNSTNEISALGLLILLAFWRMRQRRRYT